MSLPSNVQCALERILDHEGGYTKNPNDTGNWTGGAIGKGTLKGTKYGISAASYPDVDIVNLTLDKAMEIYYRDYWLKNKLDNFNFCLAYQVFDAAIQHGSVTAIKLLQKAVGATVDGIIGNQTITKAREVNQNEASINFIAERIKYYTSLSSRNWSSFGLGWMRRMSINLKFLAIDLVE